MAADLIRSMIAYWKEFDLPKVQEELDWTASMLAIQCEEIDVSGKILMDKSREFKRSSSEDVQRATSPLLKSFQAEIDGMIRRSKTAESAFLTVYKKLTSMPDMMPVLMAAERLQNEIEKLQSSCHCQKDAFKFVASQEVSDTSKCKDNDKEMCNERVERDNLNSSVSPLIEISSAAIKDQTSKSFCYGWNSVDRFQSPVKVAGLETGETTLTSQAVSPIDHNSLAMKCSRSSTQCLKVDTCNKVDVLDQDKSSNQLLLMMGCSDMTLEQEVSSRERMKNVRQKKDMICSQEIINSCEDIHCNYMSNHGCLNSGPNDDKVTNESTISGDDALSSKDRGTDESLVTYKASEPNSIPAPNEDVVHSEETILYPHMKACANSCDNRMQENLMSNDDSLQGDSVPDDGTVCGGDAVPDGSRNCVCQDSPDVNALALRKNSWQRHQDDLQYDSDDSAIKEDSLCQISEDHCKDKTNSHSRWCHKLEEVTQSDKATDLSSGHISAVDMVTSQIKHENGSSFHDDGQHPKTKLWLHDSATTHCEGFSFVPAPLLCSPPAAHLHNRVTSNPADLSLGPLDTPLQGLRADCTETSATPPLDTLDVARRIREILSFHNLGQRLFARCVLGLSQGTVSELLSKPKHWDKLTEKGRDSYRKMYSWANDERNILTLKSLGSPKCNVSSCQQEVSSAEERIAQILSEAQAAMQLKQEATIEPFHKSSLSMTKVFEPYTQSGSHAEPERCTRKLKASRKTGSGVGSCSRNEASKSRKVQAESENLTREIVARIYQEELEKLASAAEASGNIVELITYRQELARLGQNWLRRPKTEGQKMTEDKENREEVKLERLGLKKVTNESVERAADGKIDSDLPQDLTVSCSSTSVPLSPAEGSAYAIIRASSADNPNCSVASSSAGGLLSPLQRMQSIANSLMLETPSTLTQQQSVRVILPPISQEQFDLYANVNTEELVKRVKEVLSQYSISQRLFGENVLGLSQGSVSDLLARPKPWHLLTQKGREPFIRMQMFIEDSESVHRLVASQYRVPTEKLLRNNSSSRLETTPGGNGNEPHDFSSMTSRSSTPFLSPVSSLHAIDATLPMSDSLSSSVLSDTTSSPSASNSKSTKSVAPTSVGFPSMGVAMVPSVLSLFGATFLPSTQFGPLVNVDLHRLYGDMLPVPNPMPEGSSPGAIPAELDTQAITAKVKEVLQVNNLGQKLFGEAVLELSQGSVSELLSKPKPWHMLSLKGREPFVKMQLWLADPLGVQKLHTYQTHMAGRKRKSACDVISGDKPSSQKKPRLFFSEEQKEALKQAYLRDPYPNQAAIEQLANELDIGVKTVINWFHNHRMRAKQHHTCNSPTSTTTGSPTGIVARVKVEVSEDASDCAGPAATVCWLPEDSNSVRTCKPKCESPRVEQHSSEDQEKLSPSFCLPSALPRHGRNSTENRRSELNKRKRARPHKLCGSEFDAALDSAIDLSIARSSCSSDPDKDRIMFATHQQLDNTTDNQDESIENKQDDKICQKTETKWNDVLHRKTNIEKLQQNLLLVPPDDWEF